jgi:hypothetical protein
VKAGENTFEVRIEEAISGLKDFQLKTADYVFDQLYNKNRHKMLIADEVGLGKTIVAKGIIAKAFRRYLEQGGPTKKNPTFNVVYICSNLTLAAQNIGNLNFLVDDKYVDDIITRLIYLAYQPDEKPKIFLINALTPGTSFDEKSHQGERDERAILFRLLAEYSPFVNRINGLKWLLKGTIKDINNWKNAIDEHWSNSDLRLRRDLFHKFRQELNSSVITRESLPRLFDYLHPKRELSFWHALLRICDDINGKNVQQFNFISEVIRHLRRILSKLCLEYLNADIFILDEFQRYNNLIKLDDEAESPAIKLARAVFEIKDAKILMLSATPFKPFTNDFDEINGEVHYKEFESVLKFLMRDETDEFWSKFRHDRKVFFSYLRMPEKLKENLEDAKDIKISLESTYRKSIVRTERLMASVDRDSMIHSVLKDKPLELQPEDIDDFVSLDGITQHLNRHHNTQLPIPLEYVKSSPFVFSFLDNYQHKKKLEELLNQDSELTNLVRKTGHAWINLKTMKDYKPIIPQEGDRLPNAKLRLLLDETVQNGGWKYLWIPPTISYYNPDGPYKGSKGYSKSLIFSSWLLVPRMISSIVSYEAERRCIGDPKSISEKEQTEEQRNYFARRRSPRPQFTFKVEKEDGEPRQMMSVAYLYPCSFLAEIYDPVNNIGEDKSLGDIRLQLTKDISPRLKSLAEKNRSGKKTDWQKWYWVAPLLLDKTSSKNTLLRDWFRKGMPPSELMIDAEDESPQEDENTGKTKHFNYAASVYDDSKNLELPDLEVDQFDKVVKFLVDLCIGSPAICYLRSQRKYYPLDHDLLNASYNVASAFMTLFNKPESIAVVRLTTQAGNYIDRVLQYSIDGNIQSLLDEYLYVLRSCGSPKTLNKLSDHISDVLSIRTSSTQVDDLNTFLNKTTNGSDRSGKSIRSHFAVDFGNQKISTAKRSGRQINIREAFNSPFRPFVLATTSIGQEGLDFHLYCKKIFHWNLPSNAIDLEQREGRIHRYLGHVIRQNIVDKYLVSTNGNPVSQVWEKLFQEASKERFASKAACELVPYWHTESVSNIRIERFVPLYPYSRDIEKYRQLLKILTFYRLTFGQPRQEELIEALYQGQLDEDFKTIMDDLIINLSPIKFFQLDQ